MNTNTTQTTKQADLRAGLAQIAPIWLERDATLKKIADYVSMAADDHCDLVIFGEALAPGYPFWLQHTGGAKFNDAAQKEMHAHYLNQSVVIERGDLAHIQNLCDQKNIATTLGIVERPSDRGGHSLYCSLVHIDQAGEIRSVHRKLQPTHEERLVWAPGDGHGLQVHDLLGFRLGALNCWENWMPLTRAALYAQGENLHVALWPGNPANTSQITPFVALEGRSYVISVAGLLRAQDIPDGIPMADQMRTVLAEHGPLATGGSCVASPDGQWLLEPVIDQEGLFSIELDLARVWQERQNFDPAGHYSRPDVARLVLDRTRQSTLSFTDDDN